MSGHDQGIAYLIGQFPAINHFYLAQEIRLLRKQGFRIEVASISPPDRPISEMRPEEREEAANVYCVKRGDLGKIIIAHLEMLLTRPLAFVNGFAAAMQAGRTQKKSFRYGFYYFAEALLVGKWMQRNHIKHLHSSFASTIGLIAARVFPISHSFGVYGYGELYNPRGNVLREKIASSNFVRSVSRHGCGQLMLASSPENWGKIRYLPLGVEVAALPPKRGAKESLPFEILCVGRLAPEKGQRILLSAIARVVRAGKDVRCRLVGDGPDKEVLQQLARDAGISDRIVFEGWVGQDRLDEFYASADVFALASLYEGTPIVLMEAMSREIPCIAPRINGVPEIIDHGVDGYLFNPADDEELARLITQLIENPAIARQFGLQGRKKVQAQYDIAANTEMLARTFREVLCDCEEG